MIAIQSQNFDFSTNTVIEWLLSFKVPFVRFNKEDKSIWLKTFELSNSNRIRIVLNVHGTDVDIDDITVYWNRRGAIGIRAEFDKKLLPNKLPQKFKNEVEKNYNEQFQTLTRYLESRLYSKQFTLGNPKRSKINKLAVLSEAVNVGLKIPQTIITNNKSYLRKLLSKKKLISKSIQESVFVPGEDYHFAHYTEELDQSFFKILPKSFTPSLFQEMLEKELELRIFYLKGEFYCMAIFSQMDNQTKVDFRKYNTNVPNRTVPYRCPEEVLEKLDRLMSILELDTGSIDMILTTKGEYIFLEVNPVGQFGMVSYPCNYHLERRIAELLKNKYFENEK
jgi:ATP-GRASP peptide maturase of grasp-with-spasm system